MSSFKDTGRKIVGKQIKTLRLQNNMTLQQLADLIKADRQYVWNIENGDVNLTIENLLNSKWNEAQFATESRLRNEPSPVTELNFTPGTPFFARLKFAVFF